MTKENVNNVTTHNQMNKEGLKYNTERDKLIISEYGRNIQVMINHLMEIEDRDKRTEAAHFVVSVMAQMNSYDYSKYIAADVKAALEHDIC